MDKERLGRLDDMLSRLPSEVQEVCKELRNSIAEMGDQPKWNAMVRDDITNLSNRVTDVEKRLREIDEELAATRSNDH